MKLCIVDDCVCVLVAELRTESSSVIRCAASACPDVAVQLITQSIDEEMQQSPQPGQSSISLLLCVSITACCADRLDSIERGQ